MVNNMDFDGFKDDIVIDVLVEILCVESGEVRSGIWKDWNYNEWWWTDGNASCDCNRELFFNQFGGVTSELMESKCSEGRYKVNIYDNKLKKVLYSEFKSNFVDIDVERLLDYCLKNSEKVFYK
jgi:hypothetical protein